jgi:type VI secretion system protein VasD
MTRYSRLITRVFACVLVAALAACSSTPKPRDVHLVIETAASVNPDARNRPSPVVVRVFQLKSLAAFDGADFFSLWDHDRETLGPELVSRDEYVLRPGDRLRLERKLQPDTLYVGAIAAFRDLETAQWHAVADVSSRKVDTLTLRLTGKTVAVEVK